MHVTRWVRCRSGKVMVPNVRSSHDAEPRRETDGYVAEFMERVQNIHPFNQPLERTSAQVVLPRGNVSRFFSQAKNMSLPSKRKGGRPAIKVPEWALIEIRSIIARKL